MSAQTKIHRGYALKWVVISVVLFVLSAWSAYDGYVKYPEDNRRAEEFARFEKEDKLSAWKAYAQQQGWSDEKPGEPHSDLNITMQFIQMWLCGILGIGALVWVYMLVKSTIVADDTGVRIASDLKLSYSQITDIDKSRWESKGIAIVRYAHPREGKGTFKLDDWIYERADAVLELIEQHTNLAPHHVSKPEPTPDSDRSDESA